MKQIETWNEYNYVETFMKLFCCHRLKQALLLWRPTAIYQDLINKTVLILIKIKVSYEKENSEFYVEVSH